MGEPFISEIRMMSFTYAPKGWATCDGQLLPINQNQPLFSLIGSMFGGDGRTNFALPDLRGSTAIHKSGNHPLGQKGGEQNHTLLTAELPTHTHAPSASNNPDGDTIPAGNVLGNSNPNKLYGAVQNLKALNPATVANVGGTQPHPNMQPFLSINFSIALQGIYPSPN